MAELIAREKQLQETKEKQEKVKVERSKILKRFLDSDAIKYMDQLSEKEPYVAQKIEDIILYLVTYRGIRQVFSQLDIRYIERQVKGEEPKIRVQRDGETSDFGAYVREAMKKNGNDD